MASQDSDNDSKVQAHQPSQLSLSSRKDSASENDQQQTSRHQPSLLQRIEDWEKEDAEMADNEATQVEQVGQAEVDHQVNSQNNSSRTESLTSQQTHAELGQHETASVHDLEKGLPVQPEQPGPAKSDPDLVTWDSLDSLENPKNWPKSRRWAVVILVSCYTFLSPLASSMIAPALPLINHQFHITSPVQEKLTLSSFVLAYAFGPLFLGPLTEMFGRRPMLQLSNLFFIFNLACGASQNSGELIAFRFFTGLGGSAPLSIGGGTIADMFEPSERGSAIAVYSLAPLLGPIIGPMVGGWIVQKISQWRWIFWASSMYCGLTAIVGFFMLPETFAPVILQKKAKRLIKQTRNPRLYTVYDNVDETWDRKLKRNMTRPFVLMATQPIIQVISIYMFVIYGVMYLLLSQSPQLFGKTYHENVGIASLHYISLGIGFSVGGQIGGRVIDRVYKHLRDKNGGKGEPEFKLPLLMVSSFLLPIGLIIYGWTAEYKTHWIGPDIGAAIFAMGTMGSFMVCQAYLVDFMPLHAASALAAAVFLRSLGGFGFPLFSDYLYNSLGQGWGFGPILRSKGESSSSK